MMDFETPMALVYYCEKDSNDYNNRFQACGILGKSTYLIRLPLKEPLAFLIKINGELSLWYYYLLR